MFPECAGSLVKEDPWMDGDHVYGVIDGSTHALALIESGVFGAGRILASMELQSNSRPMILKYLLSS